MTTSIVTEGLGPGSGGGGGSPLQIVSLTPSATALTFLMTDDVYLTGNSIDFTKWLITATTGVAISPISVSATTDTITLMISEPTNGATYTVLVPQGVVRQSDGSPLVPPFDQTFTAVGQAPTLALITPVDGRIIDVLYSEPVNQIDALTKANYVISPSITVNLVTKLSNNKYRLFTEQSTAPGTVYTVTVSNVKDLAGNVI